ncbi:hypothetical protein INQ75_27480, partial [Escherichia coli]|nr:hypothetical protein [Escherichia coli]
ENGLVHINLDVNVFGSIDAALQIRDKFNLQRVIIVPDGEHAGTNKLLLTMFISYIVGIVLIIAANQ